MIFIPNKEKVHFGIEQGSVYNFSPETAVENHYYVVLNKNPKIDDELFLVNFTSKKEKTLAFIKQRNFDIKTCVETSNSECLFLPKNKEGCINCNFVKKYDIQKMIDLIDSSNGSCNYPKIPQPVLERVINGVKLSKMVEKYIKDAI
jgi:hypothetical protein